jgi:flagellar basal body-associated protein FliL
MPFCNSCGSSLDSGAKFCAKCGAANPAAAASPAAPVATPVVAAPPAKSGGALKIILIIVAVIFGLGIIGAGAMAFFIHRLVSHSHIEQKNGEVKVDTPFGSVESTDDPTEAAHNLGIDLYPGATVVKGTTANVAFGNTHSAAADFDSTDPINAVTEFYKSRFPHANVTSSDNDRFTIVATDNENLTTIIIEPKEGKTRIHIARVTGKLVGHSTTTNSN